MTTQRVRGEPPPRSRNQTRSKLAEFQEANPAFVPTAQATAPVGGAENVVGQVNDEGILTFQPDPLVAARVEQDTAGIRAYDADDNIILNVDATNGSLTALGNILGGSITIDDLFSNGTSIFVQDGVGFSWRISDTPTTVATIRCAYETGSVTGGTRHARTLLIAEDDIGSPYGTDVGRYAYISINNTKIAGNEALESDHNRSWISLIAGANTGGATQGLVRLEARNEFNIFRIQGAKFWVLDNPHHRVSPLEVSNYAAGSRHWFNTNSSDVALSTTAGTWTTVIEQITIPCQVGRLYKVTFSGGDNLLKNGAGKAVGDTWRMRIMRDTGSGYATMNAGKYILRADTTADQRVLIPDMVGYFSPSADGDVDFRVEATKVSGAAGVTSSMETNSGASPFVINIEDVGWHAGALN